MKAPKLVAAASLVAVAVVGGGAAVAASGSGPDPVSETNSEAAYTRAHLGDAAVSAADAEAAAAARHAGRVFDTHLENEGHGLRWEVKVDDAGTVHEVQIDAQSGAVASDQLDD
jgi:uncharacterized membrane protein YkoI